MLSVTPPATGISMPSPHFLPTYGNKRRKDLMLNDDVLDISLFECRRYSTWRLCLYWLCAVITVGILPIIASWAWCQRLFKRIVSYRCPPADADFAVIELNMVQNKDGSFEICHVEIVSRQAAELDSMSEWRRRASHTTVAPTKRMIVYRHTRFVYSNVVQNFQHVDVEAFTTATNSGLTSEEASARLNLFGRNLIDIPIPPGIVLFFKECQHPFFIFQVWAIIVWCTEMYYTYSVFIGVTALLSAGVNFWEIRKNLTMLKRLALSTTKCMVMRNGAGALIVHNTMACLYVNEAMLTGEATVVLKHPIAPHQVNAADGRNTLFGGSQIAQLRVKKGQSVLAQVVRTGFESVKGRLILSIMHPRAPSFKFLEQSLLFVLVLFLAAMVGFGLNVKALSDYDTEVAVIVQRGCDMITIVVPPALPLALTVGVVFAMYALRRREIFCISPPRINLAGKVNCMCFDKTGTLTGEGLELQVVRQVEGGRFAGDCKHIDDVSDTFAALLSCCHSLTHVDGVLSGDPLELQMFAFTGASLEEPHTDVGEVINPLHSDHSIVRLQASAASGAKAKSLQATILHQYEFIPALQRMSVVARGTDGDVRAYVKGSPEALKTLCLPGTVPPDFDDVLATYTRKGLRVLAAAWRELPATDATQPAYERAAVETQLTFLGFIVLENKLKAQTTPTLTRLREEAGIQMHMVTGDNVIAAVMVAKACELIRPSDAVYIGDLEVDAKGLQTIKWYDVNDDSRGDVSNNSTMLPSAEYITGRYTLAVTGAAFAYYLHLHKADIDRKVLPKLCMNCTVFARMSPDHKASLVETLQEIGLYVGMIGDGANDSGALRAAHVGISLSTAEASVSAPLTSRIPDISCVPIVLSEGRGALATSFCLFQFMCLYSTIQFANALLIVFMASFLSNNEFLYQDLWIVFLLALTMGYTPSHSRLTKKRPTGRLLSGYNLALCFGFIGLTFGLQGWVYNLVKEQPWYNSEEFPNAMSSDDDEEGTNSVIPETTAVFKMAMLQYMAVSMIFSIGYPFKKPTYHNWMFSVWWCGVFAVSIWIFIEQRPDVYEFLGLQVLPQEWNLALFGYSWLSFCLYFVYHWALYAMKQLGFFAFCSRVFCGRKQKLHKALRAEWEREMTSPNYLASNMKPTTVIAARLPPVSFDPQSPLSMSVVQSM